MLRSLHVKCFGVPGCMMRPCWKKFSLKAKKFRSVTVLTQLGVWRKYSPAKGCSTWDLPEKHAPQFQVGGQFVIDWQVFQEISMTRNNASKNIEIALTKASTTPLSYSSQDTIMQMMTMQLARAQMLCSITKSCRWQPVQPLKTHHPIVFTQAQSILWMPVEQYKRLLASVSCHK